VCSEAGARRRRLTALGLKLLPRDEAPQRNGDAPTKASPRRPQPSFESVVGNAGGSAWMEDEGNKKDLAGEEHGGRQEAGKLEQSRKRRGEFGAANKDKEDEGSVDANFTGSSGGSASGGSGSGSSGGGGVSDDDGGYSFFMKCAADLVRSAAATAADTAAAELAVAAQVAKRQVAARGNGKTNKYDGSSGGDAGVDEYDGEEAGRPHYNLQRRDVAELVRILSSSERRIERAKARAAAAASAAAHGLTTGGVAAHAALAGSACSETALLQRGRSGGARIADFMPPQLMDGDTFGQAGGNNDTGRGSECDDGGNYFNEEYEKDEEHADGLDEGRDKRENFCEEKNNGSGCAAPPQPPEPPPLPVSTTEDGYKRKGLLSEAAERLAVATTALSAETRNAKVAGLSSSSSSWSLSFSSSSSSSSSSSVRAKSTSPLSATARTVLLETPVLETTGESPPQHMTSSLTDPVDEDDISDAEEAAGLMPATALLRVTAATTATVGRFEGLQTTGQRAGDAMELEVGVREEEEEEKSSEPVRSSPPPPLPHPTPIIAPVDFRRLLQQPMERRAKPSQPPQAQLQPQLQERALYPLLSTTTHAVLLVVDDEAIYSKKVTEAEEVEQQLLQTGATTMAVVTATSNFRSSANSSPDSHSLRHPRFFTSTSNSGSGRASFGNPFAHGSSLSSPSSSRSRSRSRRLPVSTGVSPSGSVRAAKPLLNGGGTMSRWAAHQNAKEMTALATATLGQARARARAQAVAHAAANVEPTHFALVPRGRLIEVFRSKALLSAFSALESDTTRHAASKMAPFYRVRRREIPPDIPVTAIEQPF
jgi:hypothetical protein